MSKAEPRPLAALGDLAALKVQELRARKKIRGDQPLLRIDQREDAARAPYQFDSVTGRLHRRGCRAIPRTSRSALYAVWRMGPDDRALACPDCRPAPAPSAERNGDDALPADLFYGVLSVLDQFGHVLRERGREYRKGRPGRQRLSSLEDVYKGFEKREREVLDVVASALDGFLRTIQDFQKSLNGANGTNGHQGGRPKP